MEVKFFDKWDVKDVKVNDPGLIDYINIVPRMVPKTGARYAGVRFHKSTASIVERLVNKLMVSGHKGKKHKITSGHQTDSSHKATMFVMKALEEVETRTKLNPIQVLVKAIENGSPREEIVTIEYGGARYPKAVECAPQRRVDVTLRFMVQGAYSKSFRKKKTISQTLADEIIAASEGNNQSAAVSHRFEVERQADSSR